MALCLLKTGVEGGPVSSSLSVSSSELSVWQLSSCLQNWMLLQHSPEQWNVQSQKIFQSPFQFWVLYSLKRIAQWIGPFRVNVGKWSVQNFDPKLNDSNFQVTNDCNRSPNLVSLIRFDL